MFDIDKFTEIFNDKNLYDFRKMQYKYGKDRFNRFLSSYIKMYGVKLPLKDFKNNNVIYVPYKTTIKTDDIKNIFETVDGIMKSESVSSEIYNTLLIENINTTKENIMSVLNGKNINVENETKIRGIKLGMDFIENTENKIDENNLYELYCTAINRFQKDNKIKLHGTAKYRNDNVFIVSEQKVAEGINHTLIASRIKDLINFINKNNNIDSIIKSSIVHWYFCYIHPYFDGNGRTARLLQMWYLVQNEYKNALTLELSKYINLTRQKYYKAFSTINDNYSVSGITDITPFIQYFTNEVFSKIKVSNNFEDVIKVFESFKEKITPKEKELFNFVIARYGTAEFSTKQLEKDFVNVAYATIREFVLSFCSYGILKSEKSGARVRYKLNI